MMDMEQMMERLLERMKAKQEEMLIRLKEDINLARQK
jgi:hypothetical protein